MKKESIMWTYIAQEKEKLSALLQDNTIYETVKKFKDIEAVYIVAHGSSFNAANCVSDFMAKHAKLRCYCYTPCSLLYNQHNLVNEDKDKTLIIAISQTGTSRGVLDAVKFAKAENFKVLGISDIKDAPITMLSDEMLFLNCGDEDSNAKTKGYSCTLMLLMLFSISLGSIKHTLSIAEDILYKELNDCVKDLDHTMEKTMEWCEQNSIGEGMKDFYVLGYGMHYGSALEGQLKVMETLCVPTMFNDLLEFSHGMHRSIHKDSTILLLKSRHVLDEMMEDTYQYLKTICHHVYIFDTTMQDNDPCRLTLSDFAYTSSLLTITMALQVFSVYAPEYQSLDPNREANDTYTEIVSTRVA